MPDEAADKVTAVRGPSYPFIDLQKAVERVEQITAKGAERTTLAPESFYKFWGYQPKSSGARQTMAAMNAYGLVEYVGRGRDRKVRLSDCARRIALDRTPNSETRAAALRQSALEPAAFHSLWDQFGPHLPHSDVMISWLVLEKEFNQSGAEVAVENFAATVEFAKLDQPSNSPQKNDSQNEQGVVESEPARVGDLVECELNGVLMFEHPVRVRAVSDDGAWAFVEGSESGVAMKNVSVVERTRGDAPIEPPRLPLQDSKNPRADGPLDILFDMQSLAVSGKTSDLAAFDRFLEDLQELRPILAKRWKKPDPNNGL